MKDNLSIVITMLVFVVLIVIFPLYNYFERQDDMSYNLALKETTAFVDEVLNSGYVDQQMYDDFVDKLAATGNIYDIQLEGHEKVKVKENEDGNTYNEQYLISYNDDIFSSIDSNNSADASDITKKNIINGAYFLNEGDQFYVKLKNANTTMAGAIFNTIVPTSKKDRIVVNYGGIVKNTSWNQVRQKYNNVKYSYMVNVKFYLNNEEVYGEQFKIQDSEKNVKTIFGPYMKDSNVELYLLGCSAQSANGYAGGNSFISNILVNNIYYLNKISINDQEITKDKIKESFDNSSGKTKVSINNISSDVTLKIELKTGKFEVSFVTLDKANASNTYLNPYSIFIQNMMYKYFSDIANQDNYYSLIKCLSENSRFNVRGHTGRGMSYEYEYGEAANIKFNAEEEFECKGDTYKFDGWYKYTNATGDGTYANPDNYDQFITNKVNIDVFAVYDAAYMAKYKKLTEDYKFVIVFDDNKISDISIDKSSGKCTFTTPKNHFATFYLKCLSKDQDGYITEKTFSELYEKYEKKILHFDLDGSSFSHIYKINDREREELDISEVKNSSLKFTTTCKEKESYTFSFNVAILNTYNGGMRNHKYDTDIPIEYCYDKNNDNYKDLLANNFKYNGEYTGQSIYNFINVYNNIGKELTIMVDDKKLNLKNIDIGDSTFAKQNKYELVKLIEKYNNVNIEFKKK